MRACQRFQSVTLSVLMCGHTSDSVLGCRRTVSRRSWWPTSSMNFYYSGMRGLLCDESMLLQWRLQWYVSGVVAPALHNVGGWLLDGRTTRRMNGTNSRLLSHITGRSVHQEVRSPTFDIVQWTKRKRVRWLDHIMLEPELSLVRETVFE